MRIVKYIVFVAAGLGLGLSSEPAAASEDISCCIYQGPYGYFCVNWNSGNEVDCLGCPRGPQICKFDGPSPELPPQS